MIEANALRVGNYILLDSGFVLPAPHKIKGQDVADIENGRITLAALEPIPLTEDILKRAGFKKESDCFKKSRFHINQPVNWTGYMFSEGNIILREIKHLHQLQNLYFALTGEELEVSF